MGLDDNVRCHVTATHPAVVDDSGLSVGYDSVRICLDDFDLLVVPGGYGVDSLRGDAQTMTYLRSWGERRPIASVCSGSLLLGDCGWLHGLPAITHHQRVTQLTPMCRVVVTGQRVVDAGRVVTSGGVSCGIDVGLHLVEKYWSAAARAAIATQMEYPDATRVV